MKSDTIHYYKKLSDQKITSYLEFTLTDFSPKLNDAIAFSLLNGGKRVRAILVYGVGQILNVNESILAPPACAVELIHAYSLVHDDLPAMDDSPLRRGQPSTHIKYDEATAILAGDALLTLAFECLSSNTILSNLQKVKMITELAKASGASGMIAGQMQDIEAEGNTLTTQQLSELHSLKTGKLLEASMVLGAIAANADDNTILLFRQIAKHIGLAFQIKDDLLDATGNEEQLGKPLTDQQNAKSTYVSLLGIEEAQRSLEQETTAAHQLLTQFVDTPHWMHELIDFIGQREK